jgi:hypothetical protein
MYQIKQYSIMAMVFLLSAVVCAYGADEPPGGIKLLDRYMHQKLPGTDSFPGRIWRENGLEIKYDIGGMAGNYASQVDPSQQKWRKQQTINGREVIIVLKNDDHMIVTFAKIGDLAPANFFALIRSQDDIADMLLTVLTYQQK